MTTPCLDVTSSVIDLTKALCDIPSESGHEAQIADAIESALAGLDHLAVLRIGNTVVARTGLDRPRRVAIAGHLDTVPINDNVPSHFEDRHGSRWLVGRGSVDMKAGVAVQLKLAAELAAPRDDVTWIFYDNEEVAAEKNGLGRLSASHPKLLAADFAILGEPTAAEVEGGCNGTVRFLVKTHGKRAHSARSWVGVNAIHAAAPVLNRLNAFVPETIEVDGLDYREGLNATTIHGGVAGNVIPDLCEVQVNYRFAPSRSLDEVDRKMRTLFEGFDLEYLDRSAGARPGLTSPIAQAFLEAVGSRPTAKYGWTDVARFSALGIPAVNFGPGDALRAHADDEAVDVSQISACYDALKAWLG